jgi:4-hydroxybenzoate polyprenyltransferase
MKNRRLIFIVLGLIFAILVIALPAGSLYKNLSALTLAAIVLLFLYPFGKR